MLVNGVPGNLISIRDRGLLYGDGVFRTLRVEQGQPLHWPLHYQKIQHDCNALGIACPGYARLSEELAGLLADHPDGVFKLIVTRGQATRGYAPAHHVTPGHFWDVAPMPEYPASWAVQGVTLALCELRLAQQPRLAGIKHLNRLENVLAASEWQDSEVPEGLLSDILGLGKEGYALLTGLTNTQVIQTAEITNACCVVILNGKQPHKGAVAMARRHGMPLVLSRYSMFEACCRLSRLLERGRAGAKGPTSLAGT